MNTKKLIQNPQIFLSQNQSRFLKSQQKIGKIYSNVKTLKLQQSAKQSNFYNDKAKQRSDQQAESQNESQLIFNTSLYFTPINKAHQTQVHHNSFAQFSPVASKQFRISKIYSSETSKFTTIRKTPDVIGKLSTSKLNVEFLQFEQKIKNNKTSKNRSPGHFTCKKSSSLNKKRYISPRNDETNKLHIIDSVGQRNNLQKSQQVSERSKKLSEKTKEQFLINLIEKQHKEVKKFVSQLPVPQKNTNKIKYSYPVSKSRVKQKDSAYKDERAIEKTSSISKSLSISFNFASKNQLAKRMNVKTPRIKIDQNNQEVFELKEQQNDNDDYYEWKRNISRVSLYSQQLNLNYNNRKPRHVAALIDPFPEQLSSNPQQSKESIDLSILSQYFSRAKQQSSTSSQINQEQQPDFITLKTKVSEIKQLLIESRQTINFHLLLSSKLFQNNKINSQVEIRDLHMFVKKVYNEMNVKPEIVTVKRYNNAIFTGVLDKSDEEFNFFKSVIYHFSHGMYVGGWKQNKNQQQKGAIDGCKDGMGVDILYEHLENKNPNQSNQNNLLQTTIYIGQFLNNEKHGYGIRFQTTFNINKDNNDNSPISQIIQIGCWSRNQKHGWVKSYKNGQLQQSAQYENNVMTSQRK